MTSVDELFKFSGNSQKRRKIDHDPAQYYKPATSSTNGHNAMVEEEKDESELAGPDLPPDLDIADDEEGRFFESGINNETQEALNFLDERDQGEQQEAEDYDSTWLRKTALNFEKQISKNAELRAKYESNPEKFMSSEADLDATIKELSILSEHAHLYKEFADLGCVNSLVSLLAHENTDIAIDAIEILSELTAEDVESDERNWQALLVALSNSDLSDLLIQNMERLDESMEADTAGVYHCLSLIENLASDVDAVEKLVLGNADDLQESGNHLAGASPLLRWLLDRIQRKEIPISQNKQYSAETLSILAQSSARIQQTVVDLDGIDVMLQLLSAYRKRDPSKDSEEEEFAENLFDCLTCLVGEIRRTTASPDHVNERLSNHGGANTVARKHKFVEAEGIELCLIMVREAKYSKPRALKVLDHALGGVYNSEMCEKFVEAAGLKNIFGLFMKDHDHSTAERLIGIFVSLLRGLPENSAGRLRTLAKFIEKDYEKIDKIIRLRRDYAKTLSSVDASIKAESKDLTVEEKDEMEDIWLSRRLDAGLYCYQAIALILAWLCAEDAGAKLFISRRLAEDGGLADVRRVLEEQLDDLKINEPNMNDGNSSVLEEDSLTIDMLQTLKGHLE